LAAEQGSALRRRGEAVDAGIDADQSIANAIPARGFGLYVEIVSEKIGSSDFSAD